MTTDPLAENQIRLDEAIAVEDTESIVDAIVFAFDYLDDPRAQVQIDEGRTAYADIMYDRVTFARDNGTTGDVEWILQCQSVLALTEPPVMGGAGPEGAYGYLWDAGCEAMTEITLRDIGSASQTHDLERVLKEVVVAGTLGRAGRRRQPRHRGCAERRPTSSRHGP